MISGMSKVGGVLIIAIVAAATTIPSIGMAALIGAVPLTGPRHSRLMSVSVRAGWVRASSGSGWRRGCGGGRRRDAGVAGGF